MTDQEKLEFEKQKLEFEKQKLDLERQKFEFEKSKPAQPAKEQGKSAFSGFNTPSDGGKANILGIVGSVILAVSPFLPWIESSSSVSGYGANISGSMKYTGIECGHGYYILVFAIAAFFLAFVNKKWILIPALFAIADSLSVMTGLSGVSGSISGNSMGAVYNAHTGFSIGVIIALVGGLIIAVSTFIKRSSSQSSINTRGSFDLKSFLKNYRTELLSGLALILILINCFSPFHYFDLSHAFIYGGFNYDSIFELVIFGLIPLIIFRQIKFQRTFNVLLSLPFIYVFILLVNYLRKFNSNIADSSTITQMLLARSFFYITFFIAFVFDYFQAKKPDSLPKFSNKLKLLFTPGLAFLTRFVPVLILFIFYTATRHQVTDAEKQKFIVANNTLAGKWNALINDSTKTETRVFDFENIEIKNADNKGNVSFEIRCMSASPLTYAFDTVLPYQVKLNFPIKLKSDEDNSVEITPINEQTIHIKFRNNYRGMGQPKDETVTEYIAFKDNSQFDKELNTRIENSIVNTNKPLLVGTYSVEQLDESTRSYEVIDVKMNSSGLLGFRNGTISVKSGIQGDVKYSDSIYKIEFEFKPGSSGCDLKVKDNSNGDISDYGKFILDTKTMSVTWQYNGKTYKKIGNLKFDAVKLFRFKTVKEVSDYYGADNVKVETVYSEGTPTGKSLVIFPNTENRIDLFFNTDESNFIQASFSGLNSEWKAPMNLKIGMPLNDLIKINNKDFTIFGFGWDYSGSLNSWDGGNLDNIGVSVTMKEDVNSKSYQNQSLYNQVLGDKSFSTSNNIIKGLGLTVSEIRITNKN